jgi:two-component system chemotaxis response regulator CheY
MSDYDFGLFSALVVEDNSYLRTLLFQSLKAIGVGNVKTVEHGGLAIDTLRMMKDNPSKAGMMSVDMIFSNWQMSPVDGMMLLRWVRRHKESPNRFIPFTMVTGYADPLKVAEARDMGVTEMLAKPFSVTAMADKFLQIVDKPRQIVHTGHYFGPDRRRTVGVAPAGKERRQITEQEIEIVYD